MRICIVAIVLAFSATARAGDGIVIESYTGQRPDDVSKYLDPIFEELAVRHYIADGVGRRFEQSAHPAATDDALLAKFDAEVERGHKAWIAGRFDEAVKILTPVVDAAHASSGAFAQSQPLRDKLLKALFALALSHQRNGDGDAARATFSEILRSFPDAQLSRATYGPDAATAFDEVKQQATARGKLTVKANEGAVIFIDEQFQNVGAVQKSVLPGEYRVFAQNGKVLSRVRRVTVKANEEVTVTIDADLDAALHTSPTWTGFVFADAAAREKQESQFAMTVANAIDARGVIVIGIDNVRGRPAIVGSLVSLVNGREMRRASINLDPDPSVDKLKALAKFVAGENGPPPGIDVQLAGEVTADGKRVDTPAHHGKSGGLWGGWKYVTGVAAVGALGVGAYLLSVDGDCSDDACAYYRDTTLSGWATVGGGAALAGLTVYLFLRSDGSSETKSAFVLPARGGAIAGYSARF